MPKYLTIAEYIELEIRSNKLLPEQKLPSEKELMAQFKVSRQTVRNALEHLAGKSLIYSEQGRGSFVCGKRWQQARESHSIAVILGSLNEYIFPYKSAGINRVLLQHGYTSNLFATYNRIDQERAILREVLEGPYAGAIIQVSKGTIPRPDLKLIQALSNKMPVLLIDSYYPNVDLPFVASDDFAGGKLATKHLIERGHRNILHIGKFDDTQGLLRFHGYAAALHEQGIPFVDDRVFWVGERSYDNPSVEMMREICECLAENTAIIFYNDVVADAVLSKLSASGVRVPEDLSVVSFDDSILAQQREVPLTGIRYPIEDLGGIAADHLLKLIENPGFNATHLFPPVLTERASVSKL